MALRNFISAVDRYFDAIRVGHKSPHSGTIAAMQLIDIASNWYDQVKAHNPSSVLTWNRLKQELKNRFEPVALEQLAYRNLMEVRIRGDSIAVYNNEFLKYLQMTPYFNAPGADGQLYHVYMRGLTANGSASYVSTILRSAWNSRRIQTLHDLMQEALLAEASLPRNSRGTVAGLVSSTAAAAHYRSAGSNSSSSASWRSASTSSSSYR